MLMRPEPFRELDRIARHAFGGPIRGRAQPATIPMDAYRRGDEFVLEFDLPGVDPEAIELTVERDVLTVKAERHPTPRDEHVELRIAERTHGACSRELFLGDDLDLDRIRADHRAGVLTLRIPVAEKAGPRTITVSTGDRERHEINA
ncbi:Hsp20/alpha crystallin family protein [Pseudonocardia humida]|uniref:Hsp20/alpha crystallin family protein n=1 Tax=Pseudonocardia humida TaxID=2800819 RepID=A0ABT0ZTL8_9PSEU|nr:Hsp20/alpha crystallin family protein [Pseudonocardia humida]MCO1654054.1 Hsp20/alpha crystallin family protein [Pseudonocardia humida]